MQLLENLRTLFKERAVTSSRWQHSSSWLSFPSLEQLAVITHGQYTTERILEDGSEEEAPLFTKETQMDCIGQVREDAPQCCLFPEAMVLPVVKKSPGLTSKTPGIVGYFMRTFTLDLPQEDCRGICEAQLLEIWLWQRRGRGTPQNHHSVL